MGTGWVDNAPSLEVRLGFQESGSAVSFDEDLPVDSRTGIDSSNDGKLGLVAADLLREAQFEMGLSIGSLEMNR